MYKHIKIGHSFERTSRTKKNLELRIFVSKPRLSGAIQLVRSGSRKTVAKFRELLDKSKPQPALHQNVFMFYTPNGN